MPVPGILLSPDPLLSAFLKPSVVFVFGLALIAPPCLHRTWLDCLRSRPPPWSLVFLASHRVARFSLSASRLVRAFRFYIQHKRCFLLLNFVSI